jgi:hypothetical protein
MATSTSYSAPSFRRAMRYAAKEQGLDFTFLQLAGPKMSCD